MKLFIAFFFSFCTFFILPRIGYAFDIKTTRTFLEKVENSIDWDTIDKEMVYQKMIKKYFAEPNANRRDLYQLIIVYISNNNNLHYNIYESPINISVEEYIDNTSNYNLIRLENDDHICEEQAWQTFAIVKNDAEFTLVGQLFHSFDKTDEIIHTIQWQNYSMHKYFHNDMFRFEVPAIVCKISSWYQLSDLSIHFSQRSILLSHDFKKSLREWNNNDAIEILLLASNHNIPLLGLKKFIAIPYDKWIIFSSEDKIHSGPWYAANYIKYTNNNIIHINVWLYDGYAWELLYQEPELSVDCDAAIRKAFETESKFLPEDSVCHQKVVETFTAMLDKNNKANSIFEKKVKRFLEEIENIDK